MTQQSIIGHIPSWGTITEKDTCTPMFIAALFAIAGHGSNIDVHHSHRCEWIRSCGMYIQWNITQQEKGMCLSQF